jgi:CTP:molybdopterin cytidylyltransferase MocA
MYKKQQKQQLSRTRKLTFVKTMGGGDILVLFKNSVPTVHEADLHNKANYLMLHMEIVANYSKKRMNPYAFGKKHLFEY